MVDISMMIESFVIQRFVDLRIKRSFRCRSGLLVRGCGAESSEVMDTLKPP